MTRKIRIQKKSIALIVTLFMLLTLLPAPSLAVDAPIITESTDFDVFMNIDPNIGIDSTEFTEMISGYLDTLIGEEDKDYRIETSAATIDPTDLTKWEVYDHYDTAWFANQTTWNANYNGGVIPENWYYYPCSDNPYSSNAHTTIKTMLSDLAGTTTTGTAWGRTATLEEHIYSYLEDGKPSMQFYGYYSPAYADFLYYPANSTSTKSVAFDVDATNVLPHSMQSAGFLINAGVTGTGSTATMNGYLILFAYATSTGSYANSISSINLYKLTNANVNSLHAYGLGGISGSYTLAASSTAKPFYANSHIELEITSTGLTATIQELSGGVLTGSASYLFDTSESPLALANTSYGGFGPYVGYSGHSCTTTSSFRFSNLEMSFAQSLAGDSALEAYQYAEYLNDSEQSFFVNLTSGIVNYGATANDLDNAYLSLIENDQTIVITDEYAGTYLASCLGENSKSYNDTSHVTDADISSLYSGSDQTEMKAAKIAWLIYNTTYGTGGTVTTPTTTAIASLLLMDSAPGASGTPWDGASQVNQIKKELISGDEINIYLNADGSQNAAGLTATYILTDPSGNQSAITPSVDATQNNKLYFTIPKTADAGEYYVTLSYAPDGVVTTTIPATETFFVLTDNVAPAVSGSVTGSSIALTFTNTAGTGDMAFTSDLASYAVVINTSSAQPATPETMTAVTGLAATVSTGTGLTSGTKYAHMFLTDKAGNVGYSMESFVITGPTVAFTTPASNTYTALSPYEASSVTFSLTEGDYSIASYQIGTGDTTPTYDDAIDATGLTSVDYTLPIGEYRLWIRAIDSAGNYSSTINIYVDTKKDQVLDGTDEYTFEAGIDTGATFDYTSTSDPTLDVGESLGAITYVETTDPNHAISVSAGVVTVGDYLGTATVTATAAGTETHHQATDVITVNVVNPFSVAIIPTAYDADTGITILPSYTDEGSFGVGATRSLQYRQVGSTTWVTVPSDDWGWNTGYTFDFNGLTPGASYEIMLSGQNARTTPTTDTATCFFKTPDSSSSSTGAGEGDGTGSVTIKNTVPTEMYYVSIQEGDTVLDSDTVTGDGNDIEYSFTDLPDGYYNIVVVHDGVTITNIVEIKDGVQIPSPLNVVFGEETNTLVSAANADSPPIAAGDLNELFGETENDDDSAGITSGDNTILGAGGSALIELICTGLTEADVSDDMALIGEISGSQRFSLILDLSLFKTIWENNAIQGVINRLTSTPSMITVAIPMDDEYRYDQQVYRVHDGVAAIIPKAVLNAEETGYVWAKTYEIDSETTLTVGDAVGQEDEFVVFVDGYAILHINKFSTYAFGYTLLSTPLNFNITVETMGSGSVYVNPTTSIPHGFVPFTVTPEIGYDLDSLSIVDADGNVIDFTDHGNGTYSFIMPSNDVTVSAKFVIALADPNETGVADLLITEDHILYMQGDDLGNFNPSNNMTRAEAAQMFYNLLLNKEVTVTANFSDVAEGAWYQQAVETLATLGIVDGYTDGTYKPDDNISRAEFTAMAMRFAEEKDGQVTFSDVTEEHWAYENIMSAAEYGWIDGYTDGTYRPEGLITRSEVVTIVNNMLRRVADKDYIDSNLANLKIFPDANDNNFWAYYDIVEATNGHTYEFSNGHETWSAID